MAVQERTHEGIKCPYSAVAASVSRDGWGQQLCGHVMCCHMSASAAVQGSSGDVISLTICDFPHPWACPGSSLHSQRRGSVTVAALGSLFPSITKENLAMLLHQFISGCFWIPVVVILIYIVVKRRKSDAVFILFFTVCQIALYIMTGSFRYHEAILLKLVKMLEKSHLKYHPMSGSSL